MALPRFFIDGFLPPSPEDPIPLSWDDRRHLTDVLRARAADRIVVVDAASVAHVLEVASASQRGVFGQEVETLASPWEPRVTLVLGVSKGGKVDEAVQGAVEVGVEEVWPATFARDVVKLDPKKRTQRTERWRRVSAAAAKQSQRSFVPEVREPLSFDELVAEVPAFDLVLVAWEEEDSVSVRHAISDSRVTADSRIAVVVGSEGGLTGAEISRLQSTGARLVTLGPTILRTETAGVVAPALVIAEMHALHRRAGSGDSA